MAEAWQTAWVEVVPELKDFLRRANSQIVPALSSAGDSGARGMGTSMRSVFAGSFFGTILADLGTRLIGSIVGGIKDGIQAGIDYAFGSLDLASSLQETRNAADQIFGDASAAVQAFSATANEALGQTQQQAIDAANTFGIFGKAAGLTGQDLTGFSTELVTLATDLASFKDTDVDTAIQAIGAALRGESEPIRQYGVLLDDAALKQRALSLGIYDGQGALTQQQRVLAATAEVFAQTVDAQGDFSRTSAGFAGQQKIFNSALLETQTTLGTLLLPAATEFLGVLNEQFIPILEDVIEEVGPVLSDALRETAPVFAELLEAIAPLLPDLVKLAVEALPPIVDLFIVLTPLIVAATESITGALGAFNLMADFLAGDISVEEYMGGLQELTGLWADFGKGLQRFLSEGQAFITSFVQNVQAGIQTGVRFFTELPGRILAAVAGAGTWLVQTGRNLIQGFISGVQGFAARLIDAVLKPVRDAVNGVKNLLGIRSPSRVFADIGKNMALGLFAGYDSTMSGSSLGVPRVRVPGVSSSVTSGSGRVAFGEFGPEALRVIRGLAEKAVELNVDGETLARGTASGTARLAALGAS